MLNMKLAEVETFQTEPFQTEPFQTVPVQTEPFQTVPVQTEPLQMEVAQAATRPLAGSGAGAFMCDGAQAGSPAGQLAVDRPLPRIRRVFGAGTHFGFAGTGVGSTGAGSTVDGSSVFGGKGSTSSKQLNQTTRIYPVTPGGLGPHPAREPDPV
jgi:hypothetical protein